jgi:hypothetical protein
MPDFIYKGGNKKEWSKLQSKINQKLKHENISYILDPAEVARRKTPPPPPPMHYMKPQQKRKFALATKLTYTKNIILDERPG